MQRLDEWTTNFNKDYFDRQFKNPYRSTVKFCDWLEEMTVFNAKSSLKILDVGTGKGANVYYMAKRFERLSLTGIDINADFVKEGNDILKEFKVADRARLLTGDIYKLDPAFVGVFDGITSFQTLSWLPDFSAPIESMCGIKPDWVALTSLFYDGDVNCKIEIEEYSRSLDEAPKRTFYNVYSLRLVERLFGRLGYKNVRFTRFEIDIDIPKPNHSVMGTYTERLHDGRRIQVSGPLLMNWYFVIASR